MTPHLEQRLIEIAGKNALGVNDKDVQRLCKCVSYLLLQIAIRANHTEDEDQKDISGVLENAEKILDGDRA